MGSLQIDSSLEIKTQYFFPIKSVRKKARNKNHLLLKKPSYFVFFLASSGNAGHLPILWTLGNHVDVPVLLEVDTAEPPVRQALLVGHVGRRVDAAVAVNGAAVVAKAISLFPIILHRIRIPKIEQRAVLKV